MKTPLIRPPSKTSPIRESSGYILGDWKVTLTESSQDATGNLTITSLKTGRTVAADKRYFYFTDVGEQGYQQLVQSGDRLYLTAIVPNSPEGTKICQVELATGETTVIGYAGELVLDGGWLYYVGYDDARGRDAYYRYSLASGQTEQVPVDHQKQAPFHLRHDDRVKKGAPHYLNSYPFPFPLSLSLATGTEKGDIPKRILPSKGNGPRALLLIRGSKVAPWGVQQPPQSTRAPSPLLIRGSKASPSEGFDSRPTSCRVRDNPGYACYMAKARATLLRYPRTFPRLAGTVRN